MLSATLAVRSRDTRNVLFSGAFTGMRQCIEAAVAAGVSLARADLRHADLAHASIDGADLRGADLTGASLYGVNLSEADLSAACVREADLSLACLADARLVAVDFTGSHFAGVILAGAQIDACRFSCPSAFTLPFADAALGRNHYTHDGLQSLAFTTAPVVVTGLPRRIVLLDDAVLVGTRLYPRPAGLLADVEALYRQCA